MWSDAEKKSPFGFHATMEGSSSNDEDNAVGVRYAPLTTDNHARVGTRERVLDVQRRYPDRLKIELNALATRVLLDETNRAVGVEYLKGERLYRARRTRPRSDRDRASA